MHRPARSTISCKYTAEACNCYYTLGLEDCLYAVTTLVTTIASLILNIPSAALCLRVASSQRLGCYQNQFTLGIGCICDLTASQPK